MLRKMKCQAKVKSKGMNFFRERSCKNNAIKGKSYCHVHSPQSTAERMMKNADTNTKKADLKKALYYAKLKRKKP